MNRIFYEERFSSHPNDPARFYINSAPAHHSYSTKKIARSEAITTDLDVIKPTDLR
jgi:4-deoxy-L-threo-5-hexosulose-uronate ketol-isomerase